MKLSKIILASMATLALTSCSIKTTEVNKRTVSVRGTGTIEVEADNATLVLSVVTKSKDVAAAAKENAEKMTKVQNAILNTGILKENIYTDRYNVNENWRYIRDSEVFEGYTVSNTIKVFIKDLSLTSAVIDESLKAGANRITSLTYGISDKEIYVKQVRTMAVQNATDAANLIAGTGGAMLGKLLTISEDAGFNTGNILSARASMKADSTMYENAPTPINGGKTTITINVNATYELR